MPLEIHEKNSDSVIVDIPELMLIGLVAFGRKR